MPDDLQRTPIVGVFDSGFGGLTVLRSLLSRIPSAQYLYLGDTARLPYGAKSQATIARYAVESARFLEQRGCDYLVIACNTATALALDDIRRAVRVPVLGVIEPGAHAAQSRRRQLPRPTCWCSQPRRPCSRMPITPPAKPSACAPSKSPVPCWFRWSRRVGPTTP